MRFSEIKCKVLHLDWGNIQYQYRLGHVQIENSSFKKNLGVLMDKRLDMSHICVLAVQKANCILGCTNRSMASHLRSNGNGQIFLITFGGPERMLTIGVLG
ncbi:hypothetical protein WISP_26000 [Willisornis vidua]|uniref:Uncharacterized protein n=1 Tax=Willisornis vidua TaxID=1566151 RepID=A0ABQ9DR79_9PASS|nr:hypothetical protein WISP_26000 [Willisornis vidua]